MHAADLKYRKINIQMQRPGYNRPKFPAPREPALVRAGSGFGGYHLKAAR